MSEWVTDRINELVTLRPDDMSIYQYDVLRKIYQFAKTKFVGYVKNTHVRSSAGNQVQKLQHLVKYHTAIFDRKSSDANLWKLRFLHKELLKMWQIDQEKLFVNWLKKLDKLTYHHATRSFFSEILSKNKSLESFGPIENNQGKISGTVAECLSNWEEFYQDLYKKPVQLDIDWSLYPDTPKVEKTELANLNEAIKVDEVVHAINTFKDYRSPGADMIINRDLTILLHPAEHNTYRWDIVNFIHKIIS